MTALNQPLEGLIERVEPREESIVRENLMTREGYAPYCGDMECSAGMPRTYFINGQFQCRCGWRSEFPADFIARYRAKWSKPEAAA